MKTGTKVDKYTRGEGGKHISRPPLEARKNLISKMGEGRGKDASRDMFRL